MLKSKLEIPHSKKCRMFQNHKDDANGYPYMWVTESYHSAGIEHRDAGGGHRSDNKQWARLRCNDTICPAIMLVSIASVSEHLSKGKA